MPWKNDKYLSKFKFTINSTGNIQINLNHVANTNSVAVQCVLVIFCKVLSDFKSLCQVNIFHRRFPQETIDEILKPCKNEFDWLKMIFFMKEGIRDHFCKVSSDFKPF